MSYNFDKLHRKLTVKQTIKSEKKKIKNLKNFVDQMNELTFRYLEKP